MVGESSVGPRVSACVWACEVETSMGTGGGGGTKGRKFFASSWMLMWMFGLACSSRFVISLLDADASVTAARRSSTSCVCCAGGSGPLNRSEVLSRAFTAEEIV